MSPAGGVEINLAIQDAVATARILGSTLRRGGAPTPQELKRVQNRRAFAARLTQMVQTRIFHGLYPKHLSDDPSQHIPFAFRLLRFLPWLRHLTGRFIGLGVTPAHTNIRDSENGPSLDVGVAGAESSAEALHRLFCQI